MNTKDLVTVDGQPGGHEEKRASGQDFVMGGIVDVWVECALDEDDELSVEVRKFRGEITNVHSDGACDIRYALS